MQMEANFNFCFEASESHCLVTVYRVIFSLCFFPPLHLLTVVPSEIRQKINNKKK